MSRLHVTTEALVGRSGVSDRTIRRLRSDDSYRPSKTTVFAVCVGLHLEPALRRDWLGKLGFAPSPAPKDMIYELMLDALYRQPVSVFNERLAEYGLPPLTAGTDEAE